MCRFNVGRLFGKNLAFTENAKRKKLNITENDTNRKYRKPKLAHDPEYRNIQKTE